MGSFSSGMKPSPCTLLYTTHLALSGYEVPHFEEETKVKSKNAGVMVKKTHSPFSLGDLTQLWACSGKGRAFAECFKNKALQPCYF